MKWWWAGHFYSRPAQIFITYPVPYVKQYFPRPAILIKVINYRRKRLSRLLQNRYKSISCREDDYLKELVRYIHLSPLRAKIVSDISELNRCAYCGHSVLMGKKKRPWQDSGYGAYSSDRACKAVGNETARGRLCITKRRSIAEENGYQLTD